jgi:hypothetical protein
MSVLPSFFVLGKSNSPTNKKFISLLKNKIFLILPLYLAEKIKKGFITEEKSFLLIFRFFA